MHKSQKELKQDLEDAAKKVAVGHIYVHYKSDTMRYVVKDLAINTEHDDVCVVYQALYDEKLLFVRPLHEWLDDIEKEDRKVKRFRLEDGA